MTDDKKHELRKSPPTRRMFVALLGAGAAALVVRSAPPEPERPRSTWSGKTRWIGHC
jgi:hypothetical protein